MLAVLVVEAAVVIGNGGDSNVDGGGAGIYSSDWWRWFMMF